MCEMPRLTEGGLDVIKDWISSVSHPRSSSSIPWPWCGRRPSSKEQTQYDADYAAVLALRTLASEHGLAVVVVHHLRKTAADDPFDTISGTLGLSGAPDTTWCSNTTAAAAAPSCCMAVAATWPRSRRR